MTESPRRSAPALPARDLPARPDLEHLRNQAKRRLDELREFDPDTKLTDAQFDVALSYGFTSWRGLKAHVDSLREDKNQPDGPRQAAVGAAQTGDAAALSEVLDRHPDAIHALGGPWDKPLLHLAAWEGHLSVVDALLRRGFGVNTRCRSDNAFAIHFAAGRGHLEIVKRLAEAGGNVHGEGDDHEMGVLGWAVCMEGLHEDVAKYLLSQGARLHIFSAVALNRGDDVRRMIKSDPTLLEAAMSRNEHHRRPLHLAVAKDRPDMVRLLLELGADPNARDDTGATPIAALAYGKVSPLIYGLLEQAGASPGLLAALNMGRLDLAEALLRDDPGRIGPDGGDTIALHLAVSHRNADVVRWLIAHGADVSAKREVWGCRHTALHMCAELNLPEFAAMLLEAGADPMVRDDRFDSTPLGWAEHFERPELVALFKEAESQRAG